MDHQFTVALLLTPAVNSLSPADGQSDVVLNKTLVVNFSQVMDGSSLSTSSDDGTCAGSFQVYSFSDDSCMGGSLNSDNSRVYNFSLTNFFHQETTYGLRVTSGARSSMGMPMFLG